MPIKKGKGKKVISTNIKEIMDSYKKTGKIGASRPKSKAAALEQAKAIALGSARKAGAKIPKKNEAVKK